jgi:imidazolonepropionase-like amidohydrolase
MRILIRNTTVIDATGRDPLSRRDVIVSDGRIEAVRPSSRRGSADRTIDGGEATLLPGLTDAHVHFGIQAPSGPDLTGGRSLAEYVLDVRRTIEQALQEGFTTVRDAGGLDPVWAGLVERGKVRGPRILPSGSFITQTGGHADFRLTHEAVHRHPDVPGAYAAPEVVDGADAVRRAAREQLRRGATQVKLMVSGGVLSPTDPLDSIQFTVDEIRAAVEVARSWQTYVLVHAHTSPAMANALDAGVRSIEHGSLLDEGTARSIAGHKAFLVPTLLVTLRAQSLPLRDFERVKLDRIVEGSRESLRLAASVGVSLGSGSDITGTEQAGRAAELVEKARELGAMAAIVSATRTNAELFGLQDRIGTIEAGKDADLVLVRGNVLDQIEAITEPDAIALVIKNGEVVRELAA